MSKRHHTDYDEVTTSRCERALVTLLGDIGPWNQRVYLVGGLAPRHIVETLPEGARPHVGTTDVDLVIGLAVDGEGPEDAGLRAAQSAIRGDAQVNDALRLLAARFADADQDGPHAYGAFLAEGGDEEEEARLRQEAVAVVQAFLAGMR